MADPWQQDPSGPRPFAVGYRKSAGESLVYGGLFLAAVGAAAFALGANPGFLLLAAAGAGSSVHFMPLIERKRPQLGASVDGLYVRGIGFIAWQEIAGFDLFTTSVRSIEMHTLIIELVRPLEEAAVREESRSPWRALMARCYRRRGPKRLEVPLHTLNGPPGEILARLRDFRPPLASRS